jgi:hypothetical protein
MKEMRMTTLLEKVLIKVVPGKFNPFLKDFRYYYHVHIFDDKNQMWDE